MKINTVTKKIVLQILGIGVVTLIVLNLLFPSIFYYIMKPYLSQQISSVVSNSALRQSYIWQNNQELKKAATSEELSAAVSSYYEENETRKASREDIISFLPVVKNGNLTENAGYIVFTNYILLFTSQGDIFYHENAGNAARILESSEWYRTFDKTQDLKYHVPLLGDEDNGRYFCALESFWVGNINCFVVNMVQEEEVLVQLSELENYGIEDYLIYSGGEVLYSHLEQDSKIDVDNCAPELFEGGQYEVRLWENGDETLYSVLCTYKDEDYRLFVHVPKDILLMPYQQSFHYFRILLCSLTAVLLITFVICLKGTLRRLTRLERKMNRVRNGDYDVEAQDHSQDEIGSLTNTFQMMLEKIKADMKWKEQMQYTLMVSAIDPHYIYNTLNTVTVLAELGRNEDVVAVNTALIGTLKDRMKMKNYKTFDTVTAEREALEQYMVIQSYLCYLKIEYSFRVSKEDEHLQIPKNIIQPLVENAIKHGLLCREDTDDEIRQGKIEVTVAAQDGYIILTVKDNGAGMNQETLSRFFRDEQPEFGKDMAHIGINNVRMRLNYLYHGDYQMIVKSTPGEGTCIEVKLPQNP